MGPRCETLKMGPFRGHSAPSGLSADRPGRSGDAARKALGPERSGISRLRVSGGRNVRRPPPSGFQGLRAVVRSSAGQDPGEKFLHRTRGGGTLARPNHCRRGGGCLTNSTVLTRPLTPILQVPPADLSSIREGSPFPFRDTEKPCPHLLAPSPPRPVHLPTSHGALLVAGHAVAGARSALSSGGSSRCPCKRFVAALAAGTMLGRSLLNFVLLIVAVTCATAQHVPPVGELEPRALRGARRGRGEGGHRCRHGRAGVGVESGTPGPGLWLPAQECGGTPSRTDSVHQ